MSKLVLIALALSLLSSKAHSYPAYSHPLPHRSVIYFAPTEDSMVKEFLRGVLINNCQLDERDIVTMVITEDGFTIPPWLVEEFNLEAVSTSYNIPRGSHTAILIGKDGEEKFRWDGTTDWRRLTDFIDEMPRRKREMQRQKSRCNI